jgi:hypothetical protein
MTKKWSPHGPTFKRSTVKMPRPVPPSPIRERVALEQAARDAEKSRALDHELKTDRTAFLQRIIARTKKPDDQA